MVAAEAWATSTIIRRASIRRTISCPAAVRPPFATPWADPPNALSKKWLGDIIRKPASKTTSTLAGSSSSACAPSMARSPAVTGQAGVRRARCASRSALGPDDRQPARGPARPCRPRGRPCASARASRLRQVAGGQPEAMPSRRMSSESPVLRSMFRWRGDFVDEAKTWRATLPSMRRGHVHVAAVATLQQIAAPQQRVGVEVRDGQRLVQRPGTLRCRVRRHEHRRVVATFRARDQPPPGRPAAGDAPPGRPRSRRPCRRGRA